MLIVVCLQVYYETLRIKSTLKRKPKVPVMHIFQGLSYQTHYCLCSGLIYNYENYQQIWNSSLLMN